MPAVYMYRVWLSPDTYVDVEAEARYPFADGGALVLNDGDGNAVAKFTHYIGWAKLDVLPEEE